jgi:hypothetical protein
MGRFFLNFTAFKAYIEECAYTAEAQSTVFLRLKPICRPPEVVKSPLSTTTTSV